MDIDLGCRQANTFFCVHRLEHIIDDTLNFCIHFFYRFSNFAKPLVRNM